MNKVVEKADRSSVIAAYDNALAELTRLPLAMTAIERHKAVASGLNVEAYGLLAAKGIGKLVLDRIVKPRTLDHRKAKGEPLSPSESDSLFRVAHITALAEASFGDEAKAMRWLNKPKRRFDGMTPLDMVSTSQGASLVEEMLYQVQEGFAA